MPFCANCGATIQPDARFCPSCGAALAAADATTQTPKTGAQQPGAAPRPEQHQQSQQQHQQQQTRQQTPPVYKAEPIPNGFDPRDIAENKYLCILCYMGILLLIPLLAKPNSRFCKYHANQGLVLMLLLIAASVVAIIPFLGWLAMAVCYVFCFVCFILGIVNVCNGRVKPLPIIGTITILN